MSKIVQVDAYVKLCDNTMVSIRMKGESGAVRVLGDGTLLVKCLKVGDVGVFSPGTWKYGVVVHNDKL